MDPRLGTAVIVVVGVPAVLVGYIWLTEQVLRLFGQRLRPRLRPWLWLAPALAFLAVFLIYPTIGSVVRSLQNKAGTEFVGLTTTSVLYQRRIADCPRNSLIWPVLTVITVGLRSRVVRRSRPP
jgi:alpha-glucoside transport system permease protein